MDKLQELFGETFVKYQEQPEAAEPAEGAEEGAAAAEKPPYFSSHPIADVLQKDNLRYIGVVYSAKYCPPCERLLEPLK